RPDNIARDPAAIEVAGLRLDPLVVHQAGLHFRWVECDIVFDRCEQCARTRIEPGHVLCHLLADSDGVVGRMPLPLTESRTAAYPQVFHSHILRWDVVGWRVAGLQHAPGAACLCDQHAVEDHLKVSAAVLDPRRTWVIPD